MPLPELPTVLGSFVLVVAVVFLFPFFLGIPCVRVGVFADQPFCASLPLPVAPSLGRWTVQGRKGFQVRVVAWRWATELQCRPRPVCWRKAWP